jgi:hypothetical protein
MSIELHRPKTTSTRKKLALCVLFNVLGIPFIYYLLHDLYPPNHNRKIVHTHTLKMKNNQTIIYAEGCKN